MSTRKLERLDPVRLASNPRATLASWLKYQDVVVAAYQQHPRPFIYKPVNMTPTSVASKIRDAIRGCLAFGYTIQFDGTRLSHLDLSRWWTEVIVKHDHECVYIGSIEAIQSVLSGSSVDGHAPVLSFPTLTFEEVAAFQILLSSGRILGPVKVRQPPDLSLLPKRINVELLTQPDGSLIMI